ncbi:MAG: hypothetical protein FJ379_06335 [Verrucomicrobia bacterium]|nr:hypothetical protein [Verrucomicrobiota bacterium]
MSKAFTREDDDAPEAESTRWDRPRVPAGIRNLVTPDGMRAWQQELERLAAEPGSFGPAVSRVPDRVLELQAYLRSAVPTAPPPPGEDRIRFGALVTTRDPEGNEVRYRIVGVDEVDPDRGCISWLSPVAKTLLQRRVGDQVCLRVPGGETPLTIVAMEYLP